MLTIYKYPGDHIHIGLRGEHNARQVCFDITAWQELYGAEGTVELIYQRPGDSAPFPVAIERDGSTVVWIITNTDTENVGIGCAELRYYIGDALAKSASSAIEISVSMGEPGESPEAPGQSWLDQVLESVNKVVGTGVYVGSGDMPEGYNVQIDPDGLPDDVIPTKEWVIAKIREEIETAINESWEASY